MRPFLPIVLGAAFVALGAPLSVAADRRERRTASSPPTTARLPRPARRSAAETPDSLTDTLAPCDGVLAPAPVGDEEMAITPPAFGETPIIPPELLPPQPPQE